MKKITMMDLRKKFDEILEAVKAGESFEVTRYGKAIAILEPFRAEAERPAELQEELVQD
jgi:prevent-host-death family protein